MKERKIAKTVAPRKDAMKRFGRAVICIGLAVMMTGGLLAGCAARGTDARQAEAPAVLGSVPMDTTPGESFTPAETEPTKTTPAETTVLDTTPVETTPAETAPETAPETTPAETQPPVTTPKPTEPAATKPEATQPQPTEPAATKPEATQPKPTEPAATKPEATQPKPTEPAATKPEHIHGYQLTDTVKPTCTEDGYFVFTCSCGDTHTAKNAEKLGHSYTETQRKEATCQEGGQSVYTCDRCGSSYEGGYTDKLDHDWVCVRHEAEGHWIAGARCACGWTYYDPPGDTDPDSCARAWSAHNDAFPPVEALLEHGSYGCADEWVVDVPAYEEWYCSRCGEAKP